jgi:hypothetical protein
MQAAWLKVPLEQSGLIPDAAAMGFRYHHALKDHAMLVQWLQEHKPNKIADYASHQVGACGNSNRNFMSQYLNTQSLVGNSLLDSW